MELYEKIELGDCPICGGNGLLEADGGHAEVTCLDCGGYTVSMDYTDEASRLRSAKAVAELWNTGKVISPNPGE